MKYLYFLSLSFILLLACDVGQNTPTSSSSSTPENAYEALQSELAQGWNTWNPHSVLSQVLLPEGLELRFGFKHKGIGYDRLLTQSFLSSKRPRPEFLTPLAHSQDGSYTAVQLEWQGSKFVIETAAQEEELFVLITPEKSDENILISMALGFLWNRPGHIERKGENLIAHSPNKTFSFSATQEAIPVYLHAQNTPYQIYTSQKPLAFYTSTTTHGLAEIQTLISKRKEAHDTSLQVWKEHKNSYRAIQEVLAWNSIYEPHTQRVITPVSRNWNDFFGEHVLFCWDTYFAALLASPTHKALAYTNAVEITRAARLTPGHFVPNYKTAFKASYDRSQPPIGSWIIHQLYERHQEAWLLELVFEDLMAWNDWWVEKRSTPEGYLCWGSDPIAGEPDSDNLQAAKYESGLDNSPMYENVPFNRETHLMELADVGLMSLYILDCQRLASIGEILGKQEQVAVLQAREKRISDALKGMWSEEKGIFLNHRTDLDRPDKELSPTLFYPLLTGIPSQTQAERMAKDHYFNPNEFYGEWMMPSTAKNSPYFEQDYWRGRIWGPMNFLVYMGLKNYDLPDAQQDLAKKSYALFMKNWQDSFSCYENYNSEEGVGLAEGEALNTSDRYYHWGATLVLIHLIEEEALPPLP